MVASNTAGTVKAPGLPNITGHIDFDNLEGLWETSGCFSGSGAYDNQYPSSVNAQDSRQTALDFNASRSSSIYGASTTVQPPAVTVRFIIKY